MNWYQLFDKIGDQNLNLMRKTKVVVLVDNKEVPAELKFKEDGTPYLILK